MKYTLTVLAGILTALSIAYIATWDAPGEALGAPADTYQKNLIPLTDSTYEVGTTSKAWLRGYFDELCLTSDSCKSSWPVGGPGGGSIGTSTNPTKGDLAYWTGLATLGTIATGTLSETVTGLELDASRYLVGGSAALALTSGYTIPSTTRMTNADTAFGWGNHASQGYITDGNTNWDNSYGFVTSGQTVGTTTAGVVSEVPFWTGIRTLGSTATGTLTESVTGLQFDATRSLLGGAAALSLTSGYEIPLTASTSQWAKAFASSTSLSATAPLAYADKTGAFSITQSTASTDGYLSSTHWNVFNNKVSSTSIDTCAEFVALMTGKTGTCGAVVLSADPTLSGVMTFANATGTEATSTTLYAKAANFFNVTLTGVLNLVNAVLNIPSAASPTVDASGEMALDTTANQLLIATSTAADAIVIPNVQYSRFTYASSTWTGTTTVRWGGPALQPLSFQAIDCVTDGGTAKIQAGSGIATSSVVSISTATGTDPFAITFTAGEVPRFNIGTPSTVSAVSCTLQYTYTRQ